MSSISSIYRRGLHIAFSGAGLVAYGVAAHAHLVLLGGVVLIGWGAYRYRFFSGKAGR
jgi:hypothetical protein